MKLEKMDLVQFVAEIESISLRGGLLLRKLPCDRYGSEINKYTGLFYKRFIDYMSDTYGKSKNETKKIMRLLKADYEVISDFYNMCDLEMWQYDKKFHYGCVDNYFGKYRGLGVYRELNVQYLDESWFNKAVDNVIYIIKSDVLMNYGNNYNMTVRKDCAGFISNILNKDLGLYKLSEKETLELYNKIEE